MKNKKNVFYTHIEEPKMPEDRKDYTVQKFFNKSEVVVFLSVLLLFTSIAIGAYGSGSKTKVIFYTPIAFILFLVSIYGLILSQKCQK